MASAASTNDTDSTGWENVDTPDSSTMRNSPAPGIVSASPLSPPSYRSAGKSPAAMEEMWNRYFDPGPFASTRVLTSSPPAPAPPASTPPKPKNSLSWFELRLLFCEVETKDGLPHYDLREFRRGPFAATVVVHVDRKETKAEFGVRVWKSIREANPYRLSYDGDIGECVSDFLVERQNERGTSESLWVLLETLVAQLWEMETEGLGAVKPDLFGTGTNELHVLLTFEN